MTKFYFLIICLFSFGFLSAQEELSKEEKERRERNIQAGNPFAKFGYKAKVATLSKGKYLEVHDLDSIVTIGTTRWHVDKNKIVGDIVIDSLNPDARPIGDVAGRWISPDPLSEEFPSWSPYNFVLNNPLSFIDPNGLYPYPVIIRSFHPSASFGGSKMGPGFGKDYSGDNRGFSTSSSKTARITHRVVADPQAGTVTYAGSGKNGTFSNESHHPYYSPKTDTPNGYVGSIETDKNSVSFITGYDGTNPIAIGPTPDIDIDAKLSLVQNGDILNVSGQVMGDNFPNTEAFISDPSGQRLFLGVDVRASGNDSSPTILFGPATENIMNINIQIKTNPENGNFMGVMQNGKLIKPEDWNKKFTNQNPNPTN